MCKNLLISVIIPTYNVEKYIERCAVSLFEQTFDSIEFIFVDDCSPDNSIQILKDVLEKYPHRKEQVIIDRLQKNSGQAAARNRGINISKGDYIAFVDADDWVDKDIYNILYNNMIKENAQISCCGIERICEGRHIGYFNNDIHLYKTFTDKQEFLEYILGNSILTCSPCDKLFKSDIIKSYPFIEGMIFEDFEIMPRWLYHADIIVYTGNPLYFYRINQGSTMTTITKKRLDEVQASYHRLNFYKEYCPQLVAKILVRHIEICLNVLSCTVTALDCHNERNKLLIDVRNIVTIKVWMEISLIGKLKYFVSLFGLSTFDIFVRVYKKY